MAINLATQYAAKVRERQRALNQAGAHIIADGIKGPETRAAEMRCILGTTKDSGLIGYYMGEPVYDREEALRLKKEAGYLSVDRVYKSATRVYQCPYCDCWSDNNIGVCEHCGAPKE